MSSKLNRAIAHAVNFHSVDVALNMADWKVADMLEPEIQKWLDDKTDVQIVERMSPDERGRIGLSNELQMEDYYVAPASDKYIKYMKNYYPDEDQEDYFEDLENDYDGK